jgi:hypothetical protein
MKGVVEVKCMRRFFGWGLLAFLCVLLPATAWAAVVEVDAASLNDGEIPSYRAGDTIRVTGTEQLRIDGWATLAAAGDKFTLELENGQATIPTKAMYNNAFLTAVTADSVTTVGSDAFTASVLTSVYLPLATTIGEAAFANSDLTYADLPAVREIGQRAFSGCVGLMDIELPLATTIDDFAFNDCSKLASAYLPVATTIGLRAFYGCASLRDVSLPKATTIGNSAFQGSSDLQTISLPSVRSIGVGAFESCVSLAELYLDDADPTTGTDAFKGVPSGLLIYTNQKTLKGTNYPADYRLVLPEGASGGGCNAGALGALPLLAVLFLRSCLISSSRSSRAAIDRSRSRLER